jgi:hypothetical protein
MHDVRIGIELIDINEERIKLVRQLFCYRFVHSIHAFRQIVDRIASWGTDRVPAGGTVWARQPIP